MSRAGPLHALHSPLLSWHGWQLPLPDEWSPVKIEGDWHKGSIILADLHATRLALRWQHVRKPASFDAEAWTKSAIRNEVGQLMLEQSVPHAPSKDWSTGRLFLEPEPPGRDVWVGLHRATNRAVEVVHQSKTRSKTLPNEIVARLRSQPMDEPQHWSIFDLACTVPQGWTLRSQRLNAGDLTLTFGRGREALIIRQIRPARLALERQPLEKWLESQQKIWSKFYRVAGPVERTSSPDGEAIALREVRRRRRFFYLRWTARQRVTIARHDVGRDAILIVDAASHNAADALLATALAEGT